MVDVNVSIDLMSEQELYEALREIEEAIYVMERWDIETEQMYYVRNKLNTAQQKVLGIYDG